MLSISVLNLTLAEFLGRGGRDGVSNGLILGAMCYSCVCAILGQRLGAGPLVLSRKSRTVAIRVLRSASRCASCCVLDAASHKVGMLNSILLT